MPSANNSFPPPNVIGNIFIQKASTKSCLRSVWTKFALPKNVAFEFYAPSENNPVLGIDLWIKKKARPKPCPYKKFFSVTLST